MVAVSALRYWERAGTGPDPRAEAAPTGPREPVNNYLGLLAWGVVTFYFKGREGIMKRG